MAANLPAVDGHHYGSLRGLSVRTILLGARHAPGVRLTAVRFRAPHPAGGRAPVKTTVHRLARTLLGEHTVTVLRLSLAPQRLG